MAWHKHLKLSCNLVKCHPVPSDVFRKLQHTTAAPVMMRCCFLILFLFPVVLKDSLGLALTFVHVKKHIYASFQRAQNSVNQSIRLHDPESWKLHTSTVDNMRGRFSQPLYFSPKQFQAAF